MVVGLLMCWLSVVAAVVVLSQLTLLMAVAAVVKEYK
jgi:hypothetical protein